MLTIMSINLLAIPLLIILAFLRNKKFDEESNKNYKEKNTEYENEEELIEK